MEHHSHKRYFALAAFAAAVQATALVSLFVLQFKIRTRRRPTLCASRPRSDREGAEWPAGRIV